VRVLQCLLVVFFLIFITIICMNLLTAVAIGDVEAAEVNATMTKLSMSAELIIETEFMRRKLFRRGNKPETPDVWSFDDADSIGLEYFLEMVFDRPLLAKSSIIEQIEGEFVQKYDFDLAEPEDEGGQGQMNQMLNPKELMTQFEKELKRLSSRMTGQMKLIFQQGVDALSETFTISLDNSNSTVGRKIDRSANSLKEVIKTIASDEAKGKIEATERAQNESGEVIEFQIKVLQEKLTNEMSKNRNLLLQTNNLSDALDLEKQKAMNASAENNKLKRSLVETRKDQEYAPPKSGKQSAVQAKELSNEEKRTYEKRIAKLEKDIRIYRQMAATLPEYLLTDED
jgi:hypothetical protein